MNSEAIEPAFQSSYNPDNVEGMCAPHVFAMHEGKWLCRKCGWNSIPDERLDAIRVLFDELRKRIEETIVNEGPRAIALQHLRAARTHCVIGMDRKA